MLKHVAIAGALVLGMGGLGADALASTIYTATMTGTQETPPTGSTALGSAQLTLDGNMLTVFETFSGLTGGPAAAAHIHCCAAPGASGPVVIPFPSFPNTTSGTYTQTFDLSTLVFGGGLTEATFLAGLNSGLAYVNIHDATFPNGEIRGQLTVTPEPTSLVLLGTGMLAAVGAVRRRLTL